MTGLLDEFDMYQPPVTLDWWCELFRIQMSMRYIDRMSWQEREEC